MVCNITLSKLAQRLLPRGLFLCYNKKVNRRKSQVFKSTQIAYIFLGVIGILGWNAWAIQRDAELFRAYDKVCAEYRSNPNCIYSK